MATIPFSRRLVRGASIITCVAGLAGTVYLALGYRSDLRQRQAEAKSFAILQAGEVRRAVNTELQDQMTVAGDLADRLSRGAVTAPGLLPAMRAAAEAKPNLFGVVVGFAPFAGDPGKRLFAPYYRKNNDGDLFLTQVENAYDYTATANPGAAWYTKPAGSLRPEWIKLYGQASGDTVVLYAVPFFRGDPATGRQQFAGVVAAVHSVNITLRQFIRSIDLGEEGYAILATDAGEIVYHPKSELIGKTYLNLAAMLDDRALRSAAPRAVAGEDFMIERADARRRVSWTFFRPLIPKGWSVAIQMFGDMMDPDPDEKIRRIADLAVAAIVFLAGLAAVGFRLHRGTAAAIWGFSTTVGTGALLGIAVIWYAVYTNPSQNTVKEMLVNEADIAQAVKPLEKRLSGSGGEALLRIPTGVMVQSMSVTTSAAVISGHIWQKFPPGAPAERFGPPQFVNQAGPLQLRETYRFRRGSTEIVGWFFNATLSQRFDVGRYPLDLEIVRLQIDPANYSGDVVLVPAVEDYEFMAPSQKPGIAGNVWVPGWRVENSFFAYNRESYNADFGDARQVRKNSLPGLTFNARLSRGITSPLIVYCIVIFVALILVFGLVVLPIQNTFQVLSVCSALFLVAKIAHNSLRSDLNATGTVYLEYFFILLYVAIALASSRALSKGSAAARLPVVSDRWALLLKSLFWPLYFIAALAITLKLFYPA